MSRAAVLTVTDRGLYCEAGDFHVDPWRPVPRAVITHAHADHARPGHGAYLATRAAAPVMRHRLGAIRLDTLAWGERLRIGAANVSLHPAGHVPGSAQVRIEVGGEVWVVSGDYKTEADGLSEAFAPMRCDVFVSECTFGLPVYRWAPQAAVLGDLLAWWAACRDAGRTAAVGVYALGKAQRVMAGLAALAGGRGDLPGPILTHGAVEGVTEVLRAQGYALPATRPVTDLGAGRLPPGALVLAPPAALSGSWIRRLGQVETAIVSGWMRLRGVRRRRGTARGFVLSDHADWEGLNTAIDATGAARVLVTHGYTAAFRRWLSEKGLQAGIVTTEYAGEEGADAAADEAGHSPGTGPEASPQEPRNTAAGAEPETGCDTGSDPDPDPEPRPGTRSFRDNGHGPLGVPVSGAGLSRRPLSGPDGASGGAGTGKKG